MKVLTLRLYARERKISPKFCCPKLFCTPCRGCPHVWVMDVHTQMLFSKVSRACLKFLTRDVRTNDARTFAGLPARKPSLGAVSSFPMCGSASSLLYIPGEEPPDKGLSAGILTGGFSGCFLMFTCHFSPLKFARPTASRSVKEAYCRQILRL